MGIGAAIGAEHLRTTGQMLAAIGLSRRQLVQLDGLEHLPYCLTAALIACLATIWAMCCDVVLPFLDARYNATDTRQVAPLLLVAILTGTGACLVVVGLVRTRIRERMRHRERGSRADRGIYSAGFLLALTSGASLPVLLAPWPYVGHVATAAGFATIILSWAPISLVCSWAGRILVRVSRLRSSPGTLIAGRFLEHLPRRVSLVALSMCAVIILAGLVQLHTSSLSGLIVQSQRDLARYGTSVLALNIPPGADPAPVIEQLPPEAGVLAIRRDAAPEPDDTISVNLSGSCSALKTLDLPCPDGQVDKTPTVASSDRARYVVGEVPRFFVTQTERVPQDAEELVLVSLDETGFDLDSLQTTVSRYLPGTIVSVRSTWNVAGADVALEEGWVLFLSALGGAVLILALTVALTKGSASGERGSCASGIDYGSSCNGLKRDRLERVRAAADRRGARRRRLQHPAAGDGTRNRRPLPAQLETQSNPDRRDTHTHRDRHRLLCLSRLACCSPRRRLMAPRTDSRTHKLLRQDGSRAIVGQP